MFSGKMQILLYFLTATRQDCCQFTHLPNSLPGSPRRPSSPQGSQHLPAPAADERGFQGTAKHPVVWQWALEETLGLWAAWDASSSSKTLQSVLSFTWAFLFKEKKKKKKRFSPHLTFQRTSHNCSLGIFAVQLCLFPAELQIQTVICPLLPAGCW